MTSPANLRHQIRTTLRDDFAAMAERFSTRDDPHPLAAEVFGLAARELGKMMEGEETMPGIQDAGAAYVDEQDCRIRNQDGDFDGYSGQQMVEAFMAGHALSRPAEGVREALEEAGQFAYRQGYSDGFEDAKFPNGDADHDVERDIDSTARADGWQNYRDTFLAALSPRTEEQP